MSRRRLVVTKGKLELASVFPDGPMLLIGRSPACDMVLRTSGVQPVHFLLEWAGEGAFDPEKGMWVLTKVARSARGLSESAVGTGVGSAGVVLGDSPVEFDGLMWRWKDDKLARAELPTGILRQQVRASVRSVSRDVLGPVCLEVIRMSPDGVVVMDVEHLEKGAFRESKILPMERGLRVRWRSGDLPYIDWSSTKVPPLNARGEPLPGTKKNIETSDLLFLQGAESSYFFRLVPRLEIARAPSEVLRDPFLRWSAVALVVSVIVLRVLAGGAEAPRLEVPQEVKPRVATVEIKRAPEPPPTAPPPPEVKPEPPPPPPIVKETPAPKIQAEKPAVKPVAKPTPKPKPSPKSVAALAPKPPPVVKDVKSVGLLGRMKSANTSSTGVISADSMVSSATPVAGDEGKILVARASTIMDAQKTVGDKNSVGDPDVLQNAASAISTQDSLKTGGALTSGEGRFAGGAFSIDASESDGNEASARESGFGESVHGGLDRGAVGHIVFSQRQKIRACYQDALLAHPKLSGRLVLSWQISPAGEVTVIKVASSDLGSPALESCVMNVLKTTSFPANPKRESTKVVYPFVFKKT